MGVRRAYFNIYHIAEAISYRLPGDGMAAAA